MKNFDRSHFAWRHVIGSKAYEIKDIVKDGLVLVGIDGSVESKVTASLVEKAVGNQGLGVILDNGLFNESIKDIERTFLKSRLELITLRPDKEFLKATSYLKAPKLEEALITAELAKKFWDLAKLSGFSEKDFCASSRYKDIPPNQLSLGDSVLWSSVPGRIDRIGTVAPLYDLTKDEVGQVASALEIE